MRRLPSLRLMGRLHAALRLPSLLLVWFQPTPPLERDIAWHRAGFWLEYVGISSGANPFSNQLGSSSYVDLPVIATYQKTLAPPNLSSVTYGRTRQNFLESTKTSVATLPPLASTLVMNT